MSNPDSAVPPDNTSSQLPSQPPRETPIAETLDDVRKELLDESARNRLINTRRGKTQSTRLEIIDELSSEVYRTLVTSQKQMSFLAAKKEDLTEIPNEESDAPTQELLAQPEDTPSNVIAARHTDTKLQTDQVSERLQTRLRKLFYDARTFREEQGVNILYLALGFLSWYEDENSEVERFAPLILVPVELVRTSANSNFKVEYTGAEISTNLSLNSRLNSDFGIKLPVLESSEDLDPESFFSEVEAAISTKPRWKVLSNDIVLWFFSFSRFLMYRDLHPENWPSENSLESNQLIGDLLSDGFDFQSPLCDPNDRIDHLVDPVQTLHVLDADSSQTIAIEEIKLGRNLVIQGPPGTGKSQTIVNIIASAIAQGKSVLFVAEKMAALNVVQKRLENVGLGAVCLELHSKKANKKTVLQELDETLKLGKPKVPSLAEQCRGLREKRDSLNRYLSTIHSVHKESGFTPFQITGELVRLNSIFKSFPTISIKNTLSWSREEFQEYRDVISSLSSLLSELGVPTDHPWVGVQLTSVMPSDADHFAAEARSALETLHSTREVSNELANTLSCTPPDSFLSLSKLAQAAKLITDAPSMDKMAAADPAWDERWEQIVELVQFGAAYSECRKELKDVVLDEAWKNRFESARRDIASHGNSIFRIFNSRYRKAMSSLRNALAGQPPRDVGQRLAILDTLIKGTQASAKINSVLGQQLGSRVFGRHWLHDESDWLHLQTIISWVSSCNSNKLTIDPRQFLKDVDDTTEIRTLVVKAAQQLKPALKHLEKLFDQLDLDLQEAFGIDNLKTVPFSVFESRFDQWSNHKESLSRWVVYAVRREALSSSGMDAFLSALHDGSIGSKDAVNIFEWIYFDSILRDAYKSNPELAAFSRTNHESTIADFRELDLKRIELAKSEVALSHFQQIPAAGSVGEMGIIKREIQKKSRHMPIRSLLQECGQTIQQIKPLFMMSPMSIAQFLTPGHLEFDLLLFDEASQVKPVDALGAMARCKQFVVVGDSKQLPPTSFFDRVAIGDDDTDTAVTGDMESILSLCLAQSVSERMLRWHYRSRHHSLITVSNDQFYGNDLYVIPSPRSAKPGEGLVFQLVDDGVYDRGASRTNRIEASAVSDAVLQHIQACPNKSLGIGTFSVAQRDAILDEIERLRRSHPETESFFASGNPEPFFVKNLENIQGDERDVILISVGYARDADGYMAMNFGPLTNQGGERRLNVLITRARESCVVYSSITSDDIDLSRTQSRGVASFKTFLKYAEHGVIDQHANSATEFDSEFEEQVYLALKGSGWECKTQVGVAGFFIDLAVVDPEKPGRFLLGIECDGANYHRSRSARDRDRIRQSVLEDRGWKLHRIWSTDWFQRPEESLQQVIDEIQRALSLEDNFTLPSNSVTHSASHIERSDERDLDDLPTIETTPYQIADFEVDSSREIPDVPLSQLAIVIKRVITSEGPIHRDEIMKRITYLWGVSRAGNRIKDAVNKAIKKALTANDLSDVDGFLTLQTNPTSIVRDRSNVEFPSLRKPQYLPPMEIDVAVMKVLTQNPRSLSTDIVRIVARAFGIRSTSAQLRDRIDGRIQYLIASGDVVSVNDKLSLKN